MPSDNKKKLTQIVKSFAYEVSLVPFGVNGKKEFLITKNGVTGMDKELLELILKGKIKDEGKFKEICKSLKVEEKGVAVLTAILKMSNSEGTGINTEVLSTFLKSLNGEKTEVEIKKQLETELTESLTVQIKKQLQEDREKNLNTGSILNEDGSLDLTKIEKGLREPLSIIMKQNINLAASNKSLSEKVELQADAIITKALTEEIKGYGKEGEEANGLVAVMKSLQGNDIALASLRLTLKGDAQKISESKLYEEVGSNGTGFGAGSLSKMEKSMDKLKREKPSLSDAQAMDLVLKANPEYYDEYEKEKSDQFKKRY